MGWERRKRGGLYYTRSRKVNGRVVREYVGGGLIGQLAAAQDAEERASRHAQAQAVRAEQERLAAIDRLVDELSHETTAMAGAELLLAGYHQHHRSEWRRRRGQPTRSRDGSRQEGG